MSNRFPIRLQSQLLFRKSYKAAPLLRVFPGVNLKFSFKPRATQQQKENVASAIKMIALIK